MSELASIASTQREDVAELAERLYQHVLGAVDLDVLFRIEQCIWSELDRLGIDDEQGELAESLLAEALHRVGHSPDRQFQTIPRGITEEEVIAAGYDDACVMCHADVDDLRYRMSGRRCDDLTREAQDKEWMALQRRAAQDWRAQHAEALRRFGL